MARELQVDVLDYEDIGSEESSVVDELAVDSLDSLESDDDTGTLNVPLVQLFSTAPLIILAATSLINPEATIMNITATVGGGAVTLTSNPQITDGINGQVLTLRGQSSTDTIRLVNGNGLRLAKDIVLKANDTITLYFDGIVTNDWIELDRSADKREIQLLVVSPTTDVTTGDGAAYFHIGQTLDTMNLVYAHARVITAGTTGTLTIQFNRSRGGVDMLSTKLSVDTGETGSDTAATPYVINTSNDDVLENDLIRIDIDTVQTTAPKGLLVTLGFEGA